MRENERVCEDEGLLCRQVAGDGLGIVERVTIHRVSELIEMMWLAYLELFIATR